MVSASRKPLTCTDALGSSLSPSKSDLLSCLMENHHFHLLTQNVILSSKVTNYCTGINKLEKEML